LTLHVGPGTFQPLTEETFRKATLHPERVEVSAKAGSEVLRARQEGRRVIAVGTTTVRALESFALRPDLPFRRRTDLFIKPGHSFRGVDAMITNFHLPRSSLLCLVSAFAGRDLILRAYREAVREGYRFYSYGDAMLLLDS
jgi:S-adenosylmethionine:tRNA ribosyltransferase-isomerase